MSRCEPCTPCVDGQENLGDCTLSSNFICRTCINETYESDGVCIPCRESCPLGFVEEQACTSIADRRCQSNAFVLNIFYEKLAKHS